MEAKYYVPELSELHHDFECEAFMENKWNGAIVQNRDGNFSIIKGFPKRTVELIVTEECIPKKIRVKCLDRADIESCGWEQDSFSGDWSAFHLKSEKNYNYCLSIDLGYKVRESKYFVKIINNNGTVFVGTIRNKSELRKIMQQCGISS